MPSPMQHARPACTARSPSGHPFRGWQPDPETGASCPHPQSTAGHPRALGPLCSEMTRPGKRPGAQRRQPLSSRESCSSREQVWSLRVGSLPSQPPSLLKGGECVGWLSSGPALHTQPPAESGFPPAERVCPKSMLSPQASPSVCPAGLASTCAAPCHARYLCSWYSTCGWSGFRTRHPR